MKKYIVYTKEKGKIETTNYCDFNTLTLHREDGPAIREFYDNNELDYKAYYKNGKRHRINGPAIIVFSNDGRLCYNAYYINGKDYTKAEYDIKIFKMKLALL